MHVSASAEPVCHAGQHPVPTRSCGGDHDGGLRLATDRFRRCRIAAVSRFGKFCAADAEKSRRAATGNVVRRHLHVFADQANDKRSLD